MTLSRGGESKGSRDIIRFTLRKFIASYKWMHREGKRLGEGLEVRKTAQGKAGSWWEWRERGVGAHAQGGGTPPELWAVGRGWVAGVGPAEQRPHLGQVLRVRRRTRGPNRVGHGKAHRTCLHGYGHRSPLQMMGGGSGSSEHTCGVCIQQALGQCLGRGVLCPERGGCGEIPLSSWSWASLQRDGS